MYTDMEWFEMKEKYRQGVSISQIAIEKGIDWRTAKKYVLDPNAPKYKKRNQVSSKLDPYKDYIKGRLENFPLSTAKLFEEIQERGYTGGYTVVKEFVRPIKKIKG